QEAGGIRQVLDHLEAHDEVEALAERIERVEVERLVAEVRRRVAARGDARGFEPVDADDPARRPREERRAVALAAAGVEHAAAGRLRRGPAVGREVALHVDGEVAAVGAGETLARELAHDGPCPARASASAANGRTAASPSAARRASAGLAA